MTQFIGLVLSWSTESNSRVGQVSERLRRALSLKDKARSGAISGQDFVNVVLGLGLARDGNQTDVAKVALAVQEKETGHIFYHEFVDEISRRLRKYVKRQPKEKSVDSIRKSLFDKVPYLKTIVESVLAAAKRSNNLDPNELNQIEEFLDPAVKEPSLTTFLFFELLERLNVTLKSEELLALWSGLCLNDRNASRSGGIFDQRVDDARVAHLHAINDSKIISKFMVKHKQHVKQHFSTQIQKVKEKRVNDFRLQAMSRAIDRLEDGNLVEHRFVQVLEKIKRSLRLASIDGADVLRIFTLFDEDGDGQISHREFAIAMDRLTVDLTREDMESCFAMLDPNGDDGIDINEFRYAWFNAGKIIRTMDHAESESSVAYQAKLKQNEKDELARIENMYRKRQELILSARPPLDTKSIT
eukprot:g351.t1